MSENKELENSNKNNGTQATSNGNNEQEESTQPQLEETNDVKQEANSNKVPKETPEASVDVSQKQSPMTSPSPQPMTDYSQYNNSLPLHSLILSKTEDIDAMLTVLVTQGQANVNARSLEGMTPLHVALRHRKTPDVECIVARLVSLGADIHIRDHGLRRPYDYALSMQLWHLVSILNNEDEDAEMTYAAFARGRRDYYGIKLINAVMAGTEEDIRACLLRKPSMNVLNKHGAGAIHYVITHCKASKVNVLRLLLEHEADVNMKDTENDTALNLVVKRIEQLGKPLAVRLIKILQDAGASASVVDLDGRDARHLAIEKRHHDIAEILGVPKMQDKQKTPSPTPPVDISPKASPVTSPSPQPIRSREIEVQTETPPPIEEPDEERNIQTAFQKAVKDKHRALIEELLTNEDVNINLADKEGVYAVHYCLRYDDVKERRYILNLLLMNDANPDVQDRKTWETPLHIAAEKNDMHAVKLLLHYNPNLRLKNKAKESSYGTAIRLGHKEIADVLEEFRKAQLEDQAKKTKSCVVS